ncbi:hypothetical protein BH11PSE12_BH11PSE12_02150 [soil metagenome]
MPANARAERRSEAARLANAASSQLAQYLEDFAVNEGWQVHVDVHQSTRQGLFWRDVQIRRPAMTDSFAEVMAAMKDLKKQITKAKQSQKGGGIKHHINPPRFTFSYEARSREWDDITIAVITHYPAYRNKYPTNRLTQKQNPVNVCSVGRVVDNLQKN